MFFTTPGFETKKAFLYQVCRPVRMVCNVSGIVGGDGRGNQLYAIYEIAGGDERKPAAEVTTFGPSDPPGIKFDLMGSHALNYPGQLYISGGGVADGTYTVEITFIDMLAPDYHWHWLTTWVQTAGLLRVPKYHHAIAAMRADNAVGVLLNGGVNAYVGAEAVPLMANEIEVREESLFMTGWYG